MVCIRHDDSEEAFYLPNWIMVMVLLTSFVPLQMVACDNPSCRYQWVSIFLFSPKTYNFPVIHTFPAHLHFTMLVYPWPMLTVAHFSEFSSRTIFTFSLPSSHANL